MKLPIPRETLQLIPKKERSLFRKVVFATSKERSGLWLGVRKPGGILMLRKGESLTTRRAKITITHEFGHQVWDFILSSKAKRKFRAEHQKLIKKLVETPERLKKLRESKTPLTERIFFYQRVKHRKPEEAFAELYAQYHYGKRHPKEFASWKRKSPEMFKVFKQVYG